MEGQGARYKEREREKERERVRERERESVCGKEDVYAWVAEALSHQGPVL